ncbi:pyridoxamine 5'-phosphate oxidase family protein [Nocardioides sp. Bht2]|uniref:pyridoxamine 5'-phosphate oxidase family protein n=1 Tax=Nocardioides sp. Bht2 TaxID=3392297 RepID=UPI0039B364E6
MSSLPLQPTHRSTVRRGKHRAVTDRATLHEILRDGLVAHLGVQAGDHPVVLPVAYGVDPDGPDVGGSLYLHGSVASHWLRAAQQQTVCATITELDGLVLAQTAFNHSMNYRCAVVIGTARPVLDSTEREHALALIVDHAIPGRAATLRPNTAKELAATAVFAVALHEASVKVRVGGPADEPEEQIDGTWAGVIPLRRVAAAPIDADYATAPVPPEVAQCDLRAGNSARTRR